ncbi:uncharacterized protein LOC109721076 [Ananas comosus]|uniref:Uncharacterized protein LOC109721076 n=1 Tax=Ananas comosus TaxID=4615 RepID=A0A6P5G6Y9_ANACO|nr:uncharacterized protein LOC109721076 [Ananas comosus]
MPTPAASATASPVLATTPPVAAGPSVPDRAALKAEQERSLIVLTAFMTFNPPMFDGDVKDPWAMESWLTSMEALFEDIYTLEQDKVHLVAHCFERSAQVWWRRVKKNRSPNLPPSTWNEFRDLLFMEYFPNSDKKDDERRFSQVETRKSFSARV